MMMPSKARQKNFKGMFSCEIVTKDYKILKLNAKWPKIGKNRNFPEKLGKIGETGILTENRNA